MIFDAPSLKADDEAQEEIRAWVTALRSGDYLQGRSALRSENQNGMHYCCLGVLCNLVAPDDWAPEQSYNPETVEQGFEHFTLGGADEQGRTTDDGESNYVYLNAVALERFHITPSGQESLGNLNDGRGTDKPPQSFAQIADVIETDLLWALA